MESAVGDFVPRNGFKFTYYLTRSMRVSGVVIFLLLDKSAVSVRASCPPPGLKSDSDYFSSQFQVPFVTSETCQIIPPFWIYSP